MNSTKIQTLSELLNKYEVEVPMVQRDYAQGREDEHAKMVRSNLLKDMKKAVFKNIQPLDLNFVYGKADNGKFIPLDGQQRLTTLFLLYVYAYNDDESKTDVLKKFTYETRKSSREFLKELVKNRKDVFNSGNQPSKEITDAEWYISSWGCDPTVQSALVMIDDIKESFSDVEDLGEKLSDEENSPIVFQFLDINEIGMEDSLYIKLNARGKALTSFENFKARLIGRIKELNLDYESEFEKLFDCEWTDIFWSNFKKTFDQAYLSFFGVILMNNGIFDNDSRWADTFDFQRIDKYIFDIVYHTLNFLVNNQDCREVQELIFNGIREKHTYTDRIMFHLVTSYVYKSKGQYKDSIKSWIRILKNLTLNTTIDTVPTYRRAIEGINKLTVSIDNLLEYFSNCGDVSGFSIEQIREEQIKARIIINSTDFAELIYNAEEHSYFSGQIRSALYYGKNSSGNYDIKLFEEYWNKISELFNDSKPKYGNLMRRALLCLGDYTLNVGEYITLCVDDPNEAGSTPSMKRLFSNHGEYVKSFLDKLDLKDDIENQITEIINKSQVPKNDWRYCFIKYPDLFKLMSTQHLRLRNVNGNIIMIPNKSSSGFNYDVFLSALNFYLNNKNIQLKFYSSDYGAWAERWLGIESKKCTVAYNKGTYTVNHESDDKILFNTQTNDPIEEVGQYILNMKN